MAIRKAADDALYARLNVSAVTSLATGGVWNGRAEQGSTPPYVIFNQQSETVAQTFDLRTYQEVYLIKAIVPDWPLRGSLIDAVIDGLLNNQPLTIAGATHLKTLRESAVNYPEDIEGKMFWHVGGKYRLWIDETG